MSAASDPDDVVGLPIGTTLEESERGLTRRPLRAAYRHDHRWQRWGILTPSGIGCLDDLSI